jgi:hypothetical protein
VGFKVSSLLKTKNRSTMGGFYLWQFNALFCFYSLKPDAIVTLIGLCVIKFAKHDIVGNTFGEGVASMDCHVVVFFSYIRIRVMLAYNTLCRIFWYFTAWSI